MYIEIIYMVSRRWQLTRISTRIRLRTGRCWQIQKGGRETWNVKLERVSPFVTSLKSSRLNFRFASCRTFWALKDRKRGDRLHWTAHIGNEMLCCFLICVYCWRTLPIQQTRLSVTKQAVEILRALHLIACFAVLSPVFIYLRICRNLDELLLWREIHRHLNSSKIEAKKSEKVNNRGYTFSFFSFHRASNDTPDTLTTLNVTPPISPLAFPFLPNPAIKTSAH